MKYNYGKYEAVIGLEVHAQMKTKSKAFCSCSTEFNAPPNSNTCPVCLGHPGTLPVLNRKLVEYVLRLGIALNCSVRKDSLFARKNYFYPDLPKGYQISQYDRPICYNGYLEISSRKIGITRIHMEEDAGKSLHDAYDDCSLVDLNRSGIPLIEIVSEPDMRTPAEANEYLTKLKQTVVYLDICDGNMEEGSLRCDANVSVRIKGDNRLGTKCEVKNLNSFKYISDALDYEINRQINLLESRKPVIHQTLSYDPKKKVTTPMRSKEMAHDYRYFPEPDLLKIDVDNSWIEHIKEKLPELPQEKKRRFMRDYKLPEYDSEVLTQDREIADYFEKVAESVSNYKSASNWIMTDVMRILNEEKISINKFWIECKNLSTLINMVEEGKISNNIAKQIFSEMLKIRDKCDQEQNPEIIAREKNLLLITDTSEIESIVTKVLESSPEETERYKKGETKLLGFFIGRVMKETGGKADPKSVNEILLKKLNNQ